MTTKPTTDQARAACVSPAAYLVEGEDGGKVWAQHLQLSVEDAKETASAFAKHYTCVRTIPLYAAPQPAAPQRVYIVATGELHNGQETYTRHEGSPPPLSDYECLHSAQPAAPQAQPVCEWCNGSGELPGEYPNDVVPCRHCGMTGEAKPEPVKSCTTCKHSDTRHYLPPCGDCEFDKWEQK